MYYYLQNLCCKTKNSQNNERQIKVLTKSDSYFFLSKLTIGKIIAPPK